MARAKAQTTELATWDEELAKLASAGAGLTSSGGGGKFFTLRAGQISYDDTPLPGNQMACIIVAWCLENVYYEGAFDPDNRTPPTCFAFHKDPETKDEMAPHPSVFKEDCFTPQHDGECKDCPMNEWGSADKGRGKACSNRRRLAIIPAGSYNRQGKSNNYDLEMFDDEAHYKSAEEAYLKVPVTSGKNFDKYVRELSEEFKRPTFAVFTRIWSEPDPKSQFKLNFEMLDLVPNELMEAVFKRYKDLNERIDFPYLPPSDDEEEKPAKQNAKLGRQKAVSAGRGKRK